MADPVFDEDAILQMLAAPVGPQELINTLQAGLMMALADLYDRRADRSFVMQHATVIVQTYAMLSRTWMLASMRELYDDACLTPHSFDKAHTGICELVNQNMRTVVRMIEQLQECPTSKDKVH